MVVEVNEHRQHRSSTGETPQTKLTASQYTHGGKKRHIARYGRMRGMPEILTGHNARTTRLPALERVIGIQILFKGQEKKTWIMFVKDLHFVANPILIGSQKTNIMAG